MPWSPAPELKAKPPLSSSVPMFAYDRRRVGCGCPLQHRVRSLSERTGIAALGRRLRRAVGNSDFSEITPAERIGRSADPTREFSPAVDFLRAVAVASVVMFHAAPKLVPGGFVGRRRLLRHLRISDPQSDRRRVQARDFSFAEFWARRALRILPPYLLVVVVTLLVAGYVLVSQDEFREAAKEARASAFLMANVFFSRKHGYFSEAADQQPFLHLWTLSVEEQFYLLAPLIIAGVFAWGFLRSRQPASLLASARSSFSRHSSPAFSCPIRRQAGRRSSIPLYGRGSSLPGEPLRRSSRSSRAGLLPGDVSLRLGPVPDRSGGFPVSLDDGLPGLGWPRAGLRRVSRDPRRRGAPGRPCPAHPLCSSGPRPRADLVFRSTSGTGRCSRSPVLRASGRCPFASPARQWLRPCCLRF